MEHSSVVGGSSAARVINCPGSVKLSWQMPPQESSSYAMEGSLCHNAIEHTLLRGTAPAMDPELFAKKVEPALTWFREVLDPDEYEVEIRSSWGSLIPGGFGTADILYRKGDTAGIVDWKFGDGLMVSPIENQQSMFYLVPPVLLDDHDFFRDLDAFEVWIFQPRAGEPTPWTCKRIDLMLFRDQMVEAYRQAVSDNPPLRVGDNCRWCPAKAICPKLRSAAVGALDLDNEPMDAEQIEHWLAMTGPLTEWIREMKRYAYDYQMRTGQLTKWKLAQSRGNATWTDPEQAAAALKELGVEPYTQKIITAPKAREQVGDALEHLIERPDRGPQLVPISSKLPDFEQPEASLKRVADQLRAMNMLR